MSTPKIIFIGALSLFFFIGVVGLLKKGRQQTINEKTAVSNQEKTSERSLQNASFKEIVSIEEASPLHMPIKDELFEQEVDEIWRLFTTGKEKFPIVETVRYRSRVPWLAGRPVWIADYASYYSTSRHFIARSLNRKRDYETQKISSGDIFNVFRKSKNFEFCVVIDLSRCKLWFYYYDKDTNERVLLKTYRVGLGNFGSETESGLLTPKGRFRLGEKVAIYKPGIRGYFQGQEIEMVREFGSRWIPFVQDVDDEEIVYKGYGIHGAPWKYDEEKQMYVENREVIGRYESDGCIRLLQEDIEEFFSIVITKPTFVEIVTDFREAHLPGVEKTK